MSNDLTRFFGSNLPAAPAVLTNALGSLAASKRTGGGALILKFGKSGEWGFGPDSEALDDGDKLIVDPNSFEVGFIAWHNSAVEGEKMWPVNAVPSDAGDQLFAVQAKDGWQPQLAFKAIVPAGDATDDIPVIFKSSSLGGTDAVKALAGEIARGLESYPGAYPVIELSSDSYKHKQYGTVHKPQFKLVGWVDATGKPVTAGTGKGSRKSLL